MLPHDLLWLSVLFEAYISLIKSNILQGYNSTFLRYKLSIQIYTHQWFLREKFLKLYHYKLPMIFTGQFIGFLCLSRQDPTICGKIYYHFKNVSFSTFLDWWHNRASEREIGELSSNFIRDCHIQLGATTLRRGLNSFVFAQVMGYVDRQTCLSIPSWNSL